MPEMVTIKYDDLSAAFDFVSRFGSRKSSCRIGTRASRLAFATVERARVSKIFSRRNGVLTSGMHSRPSVPSERCGIGA
jgi:hypothetical protein